MDDAPDRIGPDMSPKPTFSNKARRILRTITTK